MITPSARPADNAERQPGRRPEDGHAHRGLELPALPELPGGAGDLLRARRARPGSAPRWRSPPTSADQHATGPATRSATDTPARRGLTS